jgi:hypothetical protein
MIAAERIVYMVRARGYRVGDKRPDNAKMIAIRAYASNNRLARHIDHVFRTIRSTEA